MRHQRPTMSQGDRRRVTGMEDLFDRPTGVQANTVTDDEFWNARAITIKTGLARATLYRYIKNGQFPRQRRLGPRRVGWLASEVRVWMTTRPKT